MYITLNVRLNRKFWSGLLNFLPFINECGSVTSTNKLDLLFRHPSALCPSYKFCLIVIKNLIMKKQQVRWGALKLYAHLAEGRGSNLMS